MVPKGAGGTATLDEKAIPQKMRGFDEFLENLKAVIVQGTEKYAGAEVDAKETIDIIPDVVGEEGYKDFALGDLIKRIIRVKNQDRERDIIKIAVWCYLWCLRFYYSRGYSQESY